jgi:hypothetical protein
MENQKYNGWSNYATWLVNVNIISDIRWDDYKKPITSDYLEGIVEDIVFNSTGEEDCLADTFARAFLHDVDYQELAEAINSELTITN